MIAQREELLEAEEVGGKITDSIMDYFADEHNREIINRLEQAGLKLKAVKQEVASNILEGKSIVISGTFEQHSRDELKALIEAHGGKNLAAVSASTTLLLAGAKIGPAKLQKAQKLGIKIIAEQEFMAMIATDSAVEPLKEKEEIPVPQQPIQGSLF
jgi:DNA ligase (NAD+)